MTSFEALELSAPVLRAIEDQGFTAPTDIQTEAIPPLMEGKDLIGIAQTGGGKTAAFVIPLLEKLATYEDRPAQGKPRALILTPTRELAQQIENCIKLFGRHMKLKSGTIYGGTPYRQQMFMLQKGVDILVATPGRLLDHTRRGNIKFDETDFFVLDEADRMLDMGFVEDVSTISDMMSPDRQTVMFSATMNHKVRELTKKLMIQPVNIEIERTTTVASNVQHFLLQTDWRNKNDLLMHLIEEHSPSRMLIFTRTKGDADQVAMLLRENDLQADAIHGDKKQRVRERVLNAFRNDRIQYLVATDVAARGIDVPDISHVVNMDMPLETENYIHRVGRTGRGGASGVAFSMCGRGDKQQLGAIERLIKMSIEVMADHPFHIELKGGGKGKGKPKGRFNNNNNGPRKSFKKSGDRNAWDDKGSSYRPEFAKSRRSEGDKQGENRGGGFRAKSENRSDGEKSFRRGEGKPAFKGRSEHRTDGEKSFRRSDDNPSYKGKSDKRHDGEKSFSRSEGKPSYKGKSENRNDGEKSFSRSEGKPSYKGKSENRNDGEKSFSRSEGKSSFKSKSENRRDGEKAFRHKDTRSEGKGSFKAKTDGGKGKFKGKSRSATASGNKPLKRARTGGFKKVA